jgi:hypothetical protein
MSFVILRGFAIIYATIRESRDTVFPVPDGISSKQ